MILKERGKYSREKGKHTNWDTTEADNTKIDMVRFWKIADKQAKEIGDDESTSFIESILGTIFASFVTLILKNNEATLINQASCNQYFYLLTWFQGVKAGESKAK